MVTALLYLFALYYYRRAYEFVEFRLLETPAALHAATEIIAILVEISIGIGVGIDAATPISTGIEIVIVLNARLAACLILASRYHHRAMLGRTLSSNYPDIWRAGSCFGKVHSSSHQSCQATDQQQQS